METGAFCSATRVMIVAGKGGVGKTTVSAALARLAVRAGVETLVVEVEGQGALAHLLGLDEPLDYHPRLVQAGQPGGPAALWARTLTPDDALLEYLEGHGLRRVSKRMASTGTLDVVATAVPGVQDILVLGKVKQLAAQVGSDGRPSHPFIVVDAPAAGHAVTFLGSARGVADSVSVGPLAKQAGDVIDLLSDPARSQVLLVTLPEETPVNEAVDTAFHLEDRAEVTLAPVVVNGLYPQLDLPEVDEATLASGWTAEQTGRVAAAAEFRRRRQALQAGQVARLADALPLAQIHLPYLFTADIGPVEVDLLAEALAEQVAQLGPVPGA